MKTIADLTRDQVDAAVAAWLAATDPVQREAARRKAVELGSLDFNVFASVYAKYSHVPGHEMDGLAADVEAAWRAGGRNNPK